MELLLSLHATRAHKVICYSSSKYWLKEGHYKPKEVQKDKYLKEGQLTPMPFSISFLLAVSV